MTLIPYGCGTQNTTYDPGDTCDGTADFDYRVGDVIITSTNTNPRSDYGGTWVLIDKEFAHATVTDAFTVNSLNFEQDLTEDKFILEGHTVHARISLASLTGLNNSASDLGIISLSKVGLSEVTSSTWWGIARFGETRGSLNNGGVGNVIVSGKHVMVETVAPRPSDSTFFGAEVWFDMFPTDISEMSDSFCNKFYWKKTA